MFNKEARKNLLSVQTKEEKELAQQLSDYSKEHLAHVWKPPTPFEVMKVLEALAFYNENFGKSIDPEVDARQLEWFGCCSGFRFESWAL